MCSFDRYGDLRTLIKFFLDQASSLRDEVKCERTGIESGVWRDNRRDSRAPKTLRAQTEPGAQGRRAQTEPGAQGPDAPDRRAPKDPTPDNRAKDRRPRPNGSPRTTRQKNREPKDELSEGDQDEGQNETSQLPYSQTNLSPITLLSPHT
eukprot:Em0223g5a